MKKLLFMLVLLVYAGAMELSLQECIETALSNNETIKIQELKVEEMKAKIWVKTASMLPYIGGSAGYTHLRSNTDAYDAALVLTQPIFAGGKYIFDRELAVLELEQAELELKKAKQELSLNVAAAYYRFWHTQEILAANIQSRDNLQAYFKRSQQLAAQTRSPRPEELLQIEVQLGNAESAVDSAELSWVKARHALQNLVADLLPGRRTYRDNHEQGVYESRDFVFNAAATLNADQILAKISNTEELEKKNYDYRLALLTELQRGAAVKAAASAYFPQINLQAYSGVEWGESFPKDETTYSQWGVSLQMLLFDFFKTPKQIEQYSKQREQSSFNIELQSRNIQLKYSDISVALRAASKKMIRTVHNLSKAEESLRLYQERGQSYTANSKQLLDAEQAALQAKTSKLDSMLDYNLNVIELQRLIGESFI